MAMTYEETVKFNEAVDRTNQIEAYLRSRSTDYDEFLAQQAEPRGVCTCGDDPTLSCSNCPPERLKVG